VTLTFELDQQVERDFLHMLDLVPSNVEFAAIDGMRNAMKLVEHEARHSAAWNPDGTIGTAEVWDPTSGWGKGRTRQIKWEVTGMSRQTITGFVVDDENEDPFPLAGVSIVDRFGKEHAAVIYEDPAFTSAYVTGYTGEGRTLIVGIITMYMEYSGYLQEWEQRTKDTRVILSTLSKNSSVVWHLCTEEIVNSLISIGYWQSEDMTVGDEFAWDTGVDPKLSRYLG